MGDQKSRMTTQGYITAHIFQKSDTILNIWFPNTFYGSQEGLMQYNYNGRTDLVSE